MALENINLDKLTFLELAELGKVVPLSIKIFGGSDSPVGLFEKVTVGRSGTFLLESAEQGVWSRYSFIGVQSRTNLFSSSEGLASLDKAKLLPSAKDIPDEVLSAVDLIQSSWKFEHVQDLPPLTSGLVGLFCWDLVHQLESLPKSTVKAYDVPMLQLELVQDLIVIDHKDSGLQLISNIYCDDSIEYADAYDMAARRLEDLLELVSKPSKQVFKQTTTSVKTKVESNISQEDFVANVLRAKEYVKAGDVFQVVLSQRFDLEVKADPIDVYRVLRALNPSPYMYLLNLQDDKGKYSVVGSSPEALVKMSDRQVVMHPIAGSRPRGRDVREDQGFEESLVADQKERAEHLMLVDLARNDLLKVSAPESISVTEFMKVERFSHIMHLVSTVESTLNSDAAPVDLLAATFPAGTLSGAPKPRALELIAELEPSNRGLFGGVVGYLDFSGNADLAIAIRTAVLRDGKAHIQAGAGIVLDSDPQAEYQETVNKASALVTAVSRANSMFG